MVLAIDELPILLNRLLKGDDHRKGRDYGITPEGRRTADELLSWLRKNGQMHRGRVSMILSGSVSLEPTLQQAGLSAHANIFSPFDPKPWDRETAMACLGALGETYDTVWPETTRRRRVLVSGIEKLLNQFFIKDSSIQLHRSVFIQH